VRFIPLSTASLLTDIRTRRHRLDACESNLRERALRDVRALLARAHNFSPNDERAVEMLAFNQFMKIIDTLSIALRVLLD